MAATAILRHRRRTTILSPRTKPHSHFFSIINNHNLPLPLSSRPQLLPPPYSAARRLSASPSSRCRLLHRGVPNRFCYRRGVAGLSAHSVFLLVVTVLLPASFSTRRCHERPLFFHSARRRRLPPVSSPLLFFTDKP
ncbi:hypothetical protein PIB30_044004 [Stylosanthes scabra]|uniref:Uncharacterized protein n=1 Tax=Stylosanthes scabra TaxID=79078 RepID=A0ABU6WDR5_9FABA|nr:hypothetical protein [Stylosanthes scabra]